MLLLPIILNICFLVIMFLGAVDDWKYRIVNNYIYIPAYILSFLIAVYFYGYNFTKILIYSSWLSIFFILFNVVVSAIDCIKCRKSRKERTEYAKSSIETALRDVSQENIDIARGFLIYTPEHSQKKLSRSLDTIQKKLNENFKYEELIDICRSKLELVKASKAIVDIYIVESFLYNIDEPIKLPIYKKLIAYVYSIFFEDPFLYNEQKQQIFNELKKLAYDSQGFDYENYTIGGGDIRMAPAVTLFYGPMAIPLLFVIMLLALICQKLIKQSDPDHIPLVTYFFIGCVVKVIIEVIYMLHAYTII